MLNICKTSYEDLLMQERAYSTYFSLKYLSGYEYLSQESQQSAISAFQS